MRATIGFPPGSPSPQSAELQDDFTLVGTSAQPPDFHPVSDDSPALKRNALIF
jgi:hypothetical protein